MTNYNAYLQSIYDIVVNASETVSPNLDAGGPFIQAFGAAPEDTLTGMKNDLTALTAVLGAIAGVISIFTAGLGAGPIAGALVGATASIASTVASSAVAGATNNMSVATSPQDMPNWWGNLRLATLGGHASYQNGIFQHGYYNGTINDTSAQNFSIYDIIDGGQFAGGTTKQYQLGNASAQQFVEQAFYAQMAQAVWKYSDSLTPFIAKWPGDCTDHSKLPNLWMTHASGQDSQGKYKWDMDWDFTTVSKVIDGTCYSLLGATSLEPRCRQPFIKPGGGLDWNQQDWEQSCCKWKSLPSGTHQVLNGTASVWSGLNLDDIINSAVEGFFANNENNNYNGEDIVTNFFQINTPEASFPTSLGAAGIVNSIPVCDYVKNATNPGLNCPNVMSLSASCSF